MLVIIFFVIALLCGSRLAAKYKNLRNRRGAVKIQLLCCISFAISGFLCYDERKRRSIRKWVSFISSPRSDALPAGAVRWFVRKDVSVSEFPMRSIRINVFSAAPASMSAPRAQWKKEKRHHSLERCRFSWYHAAKVLLHLRKVQFQNQTSGISPTCNIPFITCSDKSGQLCIGIVSGAAHFLYDILNFSVKLHIHNNSLPLWQSQLCHKRQ